MTVYSTDDDILEVVDDEDRVIGTSRRADIHKKGLLHRAVHIFIFNSHGDLYVQRRAGSKDRHPMKLDSSAAGHVDPGESYEQAAVRELEEELGLQVPIRKVIRVRASALTDNEHVMLFDGYTSLDPKVNRDEIASAEFIARDRVNDLIALKPEDFVPAFILLWKQFLRQNP